MACKICGKVDKNLCETFIYDDENPGKSIRLGFFCNECNKKIWNTLIAESIQLRDEHKKAQRALRAKYGF